MSWADRKSSITSTTPCGPKLMWTVLWVCFASFSISLSSHHAPLPSLVWHHDILQAAAHDTVRCLLCTVKVAISVPVFSSSFFLLLEWFFIMSFINLHRPPPPSSSPLHVSTKSKQTVRLWNFSFFLSSWSAFSGSQGEYHFSVSSLLSWIRSWDNISESNTAFHTHSANLGCLV